MSFDPTIVIKECDEIIARCTAEMGAARHLKAAAMQYLTAMGGEVPADYPAVRGIRASGIAGRILAAARSAAAEHAEFSTDDVLRHMDGDVQRQQVRDSLHNSLKRQGYVVNLGRGRWMLNRPLAAEADHG